MAESLSLGEPRSVTAVLECRGLVAGHGSVAVVRELDLRLTAGTVLAVLGPNGAGKTTLMTTLAGLLAQKARHGSGAAWLERRHRGTFPRRRVAGLMAWSARVSLGAVRGRGLGPGGRATAIVDVLAVWAFELGRLIPNGARIR